MTGDLHCHTKLSDGSTGIEELVLMAKRRGLDCLAVTDHDTFAGSTRACVIGRRYGVKVIPAIELSAYDYQRERKVHLLCYLCENPDRLQGICKTVSDNRKACANVMIKKVMRYYHITPEMVAKAATGSSNIFKQHIMHALMDAGYTSSIFGDIYDKLFSKDGIANEEYTYPDVFEVLELIRSSGGVSVLAHPSFYDSFEIIDELVEAGLDGLEVWHPKNSEEDQMILKTIAEKKHLIMTGGTDFHGHYSPNPNPIGTFLTPDDQIEALYARKKQKKRA